MADIRTDDVRNAADLVSDAASAVRSHVPTEVGDVGFAMPATASAAAAQAAVTGWSDAFAAWATRLEQHAQAMRDAAGDWEQAEQNVADNYRTFPQTPTGPDAWPTQPGFPGPDILIDPDRMNGRGVTESDEVFGPPTPPAPSTGDPRTKPQVR